MIGKKSQNKNLAYSIERIGDRKNRSIIYLLISVFYLLSPISYLLSCYAEEAAKIEPIVVNGDNVEFGTDNKEITATGNVSVVYKGAKLTCEKLTVNSQTKDGIAEGNARLDDQKGVIEGTKILYNFSNKTGIIFDSQFRANPYFGRANQTQKLSEDEFINRRGYLTTCSYNNPHYRIKSKKMIVFPGDKVQTKEDIFYLGSAPLFYLPQLNRSLKDPVMHVQFMPGKSKEWGVYNLSAWKYNLTDDISGRIYLDYRAKLGVSEGFGVNYTSPEFGKGDFKYYYTRERNHTKDFPSKDVTLTRKFQRYFIRWRHKWDVDPQTDLVSEYWKITDSKRSLYPSHSPSYNLLKEFFPREYEVDTAPLSYVLAHHSFTYSGLDILLQKRTNRWYSETEKLPEAKYTIPSYKLGASPFYIGHDSLAGHYNVKQAVPSASSGDKHSERFDTSNKLSMPFKLAFIRLNPSATHRLTYYDRDVYGSATVLRNVFSVGTDASTNFYRIFNVKSNFLKLDLNDIRHIITPSVGYSYANKPTVPSSKLVQVDGVDGVSGRSNSASLSLSNIFQTKRDNNTVNFCDFLVSSSYAFKTKSSRGSRLGDLAYKLQLLPYNWVKFDANATYSHELDYFSHADYDFNFNLGNERSLGFRQDYNRKASNSFTYDLKWRLSPKWKFSFYQKIITGHRDTVLKRGLREQEYVLSRDLHCWTVDVNYNVTRDKGESIWFVFRLKAFPELEFNFNQTYHEPKVGELSY